MSVGVRHLSVRPSVCRVPRPNSTMERHRKPKIGKIEGHLTSNLRNYLEVKISKVKVTRPINAHTVNAQYLSNARDSDNDYTTITTFPFIAYLYCIGAWQGRLHHVAAVAAAPCPCCRPALRGFSTEMLFAKQCHSNLYIGQQLTRCLPRPQPQSQLILQWNIEAV